MAVRWGTFLGALLVSVGLLVTMAIGLTQEAREVRALDSQGLVITRDPGGILGTFIHKYQRIWASGEKIVVKQECDSACTLMLKIVRPQQVCVYPGAIFGFHSSTETGPGVPARFSRSGTELMWSLWTEKVHGMLRARGWDGPWQPHPDIIPILGTELYQQCQKS